MRTAGRSEAEAGQPALVTRSPESALETGHKGARHQGELVRPATGIALETDHPITLSGRLGVAGECRAGDLWPEPLYLAEEGRGRELRLEITERGAQRAGVTALHAARSPCAPSATPSVTFTRATSAAASAGTWANSVAVNSA